MAHRSIRRLPTAFSGAALALTVPWLMASAMTVAAADGTESPGPDWTVPVPDLGSPQTSSPVAVLARDGALAAITAHQSDDTVQMQGFDVDGDVTWRRELLLADVGRVELRACGRDRTCLLSDVGGAWLEDADGTIVASLPPARDVVTGAEGGLYLLQFQFDHDCVPSASCPHRGARIDISTDGDVVAEHLFEGAPLAMSPGGAVVVHDDGTTFLLDVDGDRLPYAEDAIPGLTWFRHRLNLTGWGHSGLVDDDGRFIGLRGGCLNLSPFPCETHEVIAMDRDGLLWAADTAVPGHSRISHWEFQRIANVAGGADAADSDADILVAIHHAPRETPPGAPVRDDRLNLLRLGAGGQIVWQRNLLSAGMGASRLFQLPGQQSLALVRPGNGGDSLVLTVLDAASGQLHGEQAVACPAQDCQSWWFDVGAGGSGDDAAEPALMALAQAGDSAWLMRQAGAGQFQAVPGIALAQGGLSGAWYAPRSAGQGFALQLLPGADGTHVFMPWFTFHGGYIYPDVEALRWYVLEGLVDPDDTDARLTVWQVTVVVLGGGDVLADDVGADGEFSVPAVHEDREPHDARATEVVEGVQRGPDRAVHAALERILQDHPDVTRRLRALWTLHVTDGLNVTGGLRYTDEEKTYTFSRTSPLPGVPTDFRVAPLDGLSRTFAGDNIDWRLAVDYEVAPDIRFYGQVATGFKGGGVNPRPYYETQAVPYEQEKATSYELGLKSTWLERRLRLNLAYYHTDYSDYQGQVSLCHDITPEPLWNTPADLCTATRNVGDAKIDGFEVELDARPIPGLSIDGAFSYTDFRFVNGIEGSNIVPGVTQAAFVPEWKYALGAQYEIWLGDAGTLTPRLDWTWQSEMQSTIPNNAPGYELGEIESRGLLNARITYRTADEDWEFALAATNLTDQFYYNNKYDRSNQVGGNAYGMPGRPREFMASIKRNF